MGARTKKSTEQRLLEFLGSPRYEPLNKTNLAKRLEIPVNERSRFRRLLSDLETRGKITRIRKDRYVLPKEADLMVGVLQVNPRGFGYLLNESGDGLGDLYISAENQSTAMHRDRVVARIVRDRVAPERGGRSRANREGRVIKILVKANQTIVGTLQRSKNFYYVVPDEPALVHDIYVTVQAGQFPRTPEVNDKVVVRLEPWEHRHVNPEGEIVMDASARRRRLQARANQGCLLLHLTLPTGVSAAFRRAPLFSIRNPCTNATCWHRFAKRSVERQASIRCIRFGGSDRH